MNYFATAVQGLGKILESEIAERLEGVHVHSIEFDGRNDIVSFGSEPFDPHLLRVSEDVYAEVGHAGGRTMKEVLGRLLQPEELERTLSVFASRVKPLRARMSFRVIARVLSERTFLRSELKDEATQGLQVLRPRWEFSDPAELEFWILETKSMSFRLGLRLTGPEMRHRIGRAVERSGSLKPTIAAAMVYVAGKPDGRPLIDPACGTGTILAEALHAQWKAFGSDIDQVAVEASRRNVSEAPSLVADARSLPFQAGHFGAVVSNLPFGKQFRVQGSATLWLEAVLRECVRVGGAQVPIILLVPANKPFLRGLDRQNLDVVRRYNLRVRGQSTALWEITS